MKQFVNNSFISFSHIYDNYTILAKYRKNIGDSLQTNIRRYNNNSLTIVNYIGLNVTLHVNIYGRILAPINLFCCYQHIYAIYNKTSRRLMDKNTLISYSVYKISVLLCYYMQETTVICITMKLHSINSH